jgi:bifunctional oligoribonuclease and PAP phosphatase NrnA
MSEVVSPVVSTAPPADPPGELIGTLACAARPVVAGHVTPDVDALGSMLALARALPATEAAIALPGIPVSQKLRFLLDLAGDVAVADAARIADADVVVTVDTAGTNRVFVPGKWESIADKLVVNIDHHITNPDYGRLNWVVASASSTCELIYRLIAAAGWPLDAATATLLYAGIYADTGGFTLPNATASAFEAAAALVRAGADVERVGSRLCRSQEQHEFDLIRTVYHNTRLAAGGRIAYSTLTYDEIKAANCTPEDIDDQVSIPRSLSRIRIAMLLSEGERGVIRVNFRGEAGTPVLPLAEKLGGGGHTYSAGSRIRGPMPEVVDRVLEAATAQLDQA